MPQSYSAVFLHIIFSTKKRVPFLEDRAVREDVHRYLAAVSTEHRCPTIQVGGFHDHVHLLVQQGKTVAHSDLVRDLKRSSSMWFKEQGSRFRDFHWQTGYAALSVSPLGVEGVREYILRQEEHHRRTTFQDEYRRILIEHGLDLNEERMWE